MQQKRLGTTTGRTVDALLDLGEAVVVSGSSRSSSRGSSSRSSRGSGGRASASRASASSLLSRLTLPLLSLGAATRAAAVVRGAASSTSASEYRADTACRVIAGSVIRLIVACSSFPCRYRYPLLRFKVCSPAHTVAKVVLPGWWW